MTARDVVVLALAGLEEAEDATASAYGPPLAAVVVAAWRRDPARFGLRFHEDRFPDSNRVNVELCKRVVGGGLAYRAAPGRYRLTPAGWAAAALARAGRPTAAPGRRRKGVPA